VERGCQNAVLHPSENPRIAPPTDKYLDTTIDRWSLQAEPVPLLGGTTGHGPTLDPVETPVLVIVPGATQRCCSPSTACKTRNPWLTPPARRRPGRIVATVLRPRRRRHRRGAAVTRHSCCRTTTHPRSRY
jgi:hypothetical protein